MAGFRYVRVLAAPVAAGLLMTGFLSPAAASSASTDPVPKGTIVGGSRLAAKDTVTDLAEGTPAPPVPKAVSWLVADLETRQIIAARKVHAQLAPASTMKIFTALTIAPMVDPDAVYTASDASAQVDGSKVGLVSGSRYTVDQLLHGMIMSSGNDCSVALGELVGGQKRATALMQAQARKLGAFDTTVRTTSGLDAPGQASSAYDLALAGAAALQNPQIEKIMTTRAFAFPSAGKGLGKTRKTYSIQTHNKLIYNTPGATGVKNGYTIAARGSFVGSATRNGHSYIAVVLRTEGSTWHATDDLLEWAFAHGDAASPVGTLISPADVQALIAPMADVDGGGAAAAAPELRGAQPAAVASSSSSPLSERTRTILLVALIVGLLIAVTAGGLLIRRPPERQRW